MVLALEEGGSRADESRVRRSNSAPVVFSEQVTVRIENRVKLTQTAEEVNERPCSRTLVSISVDRLYMWW